MLAKSKTLWHKNWNLLGEGYGFFIFLVLSIGSILGFSFYQFSPALQPLHKITFIIASIFHLTLHWFSALFFESRKRSVMLTLIQSTLALLIVVIISRFDLIFAIFAALIGTMSGSLLPLRHKFFSILWYAGLMGLSAYYLSGTVNFDLWWPTLVSTTFIIIIFSIAFDMQTRAQKRSEGLLSELSEAHIELAQYAEQVQTLTLENERQRIARELHDTLSQGLAGLILNLEAISSQVEHKNETRAQEILKQSMKNARTTLAEARDVIDNLRSIERSDTDFETQIKVAAARFEASAYIPCEVNIEEGVEFSVRQKKQVLRIVNEILSNVGKHAKAQKVQMHFSCAKENHQIYIKDDGRGFMPEDAMKKEGSYGLLGIQERVTLLQGNLEIASQPGSGTEIWINIPIEGQHA